MRNTFSITILILVFCLKAQAQTLTTYTYDARGNRISKQVRGSSPHPTVTASPEAVNPSQPTVLTATGCTGGSLQWQPANLSGSQITVNPTTTTQYTAQCVVSGCANSGVGKVKVTLIQCPSLSISAFSNVQTIRNGSQVILYANGCNIFENGESLGQITWSTGAIGSPVITNQYGTSTVYTATCGTQYCPNIATAAVIVGGIASCGSGEVIVSRQMGSWHDVSTWLCGRVPTINDEVFINHPINVLATGYAKTLIKGDGYLLYSENGTIVIP